MDARVQRLALALFLTLVIVALRTVAPMPSDGWLFLLIAPIAIVAIEFSFAGGLVAALLAVVFVFLFKLVGDIDYSFTGVAIRTLTFMFAGAGVGYLVEERKRRERALRELQRRAAEHDEGLQLNDEVVQGLVVAKLAIEMGEVDKASTSLETTLKRAQEFASRRLSYQSSLTRDPGPGSASAPE